MNVVICYYNEDGESSITPKKMKVLPRVGERVALRRKHKVIYLRVKDILHDETIQLTCDLIRVEQFKD